MRNYLSICLVLALTLSTLTGAGAQTIPDVGFGGLGAGFVNLPLNQGGFGRDFGTDMKVRPDGRIVIAGAVDNGTGLIAGIYQLTAEGLPDPSFGGGDGHAVFIDPGDPSASLVVYCLALQSDGKIVLAGQTPEDDGQNHAFVMRINADGTALDASFDGDGIARPRADDYRDLAIDGDGRIVLVGTFTLHVLGLPPLPGYNTDRIAVTRLQSNGSLDPSFGVDGQPYFHFGTDANPLQDHDFRGRALALAPNGRILVAAEIWTPDHGTDFGVLGLLENGTPDPSFGNYGPGGQTRVQFDQAGAGCTEDLVTDIGVHHSPLFPALDRILLVGQTCLSDGNREFAVARLYANGALDVAFADTGRKSIGFDLGELNFDAAKSLAFQSPAGVAVGAPPSHLVVAGVARGASSNYDIALVRLRLSDGTLDSSFGNGGRYLFAIDLGGPLIDFVEAVATTPSKITIAGWISTPRNNGNDRDFLAARFVVDETLFRNGFE